MKNPSRFCGSLRNIADLTLSPYQAVTSWRVREKETMLLASVVCLSKQVSVTLLIPRRNPVHPLEWKCRESNPSPQYWWCNLFLKRGKRNTGFEPVTSNLEGWRSTTELISRVGRRNTVYLQQRGLTTAIVLPLIFSNSRLRIHLTPVSWYPRRPPQPVLLQPYPVLDHTGYSAIPYGEDQSPKPPTRLELATTALQKPCSTN